MIAPVRSCSQRLLVARAPHDRHSLPLAHFGCCQEDERKIRSLYGMVGWVDCHGGCFFRFISTPIAFPVACHALHSPAVMRRACVAGFGAKLYAGEVMDPSVIVGQPHKDWKDLHRPQEPRLLVLWFNSGVRKLYVPPHWFKRRFTHTPA